MMRIRSLVVATVVAALVTMLARGDEAWFVGLGCPLPGDCETLAWGVSADGGTVVGDVEWSGSGYQGPFVWTASTGTVAIGLLPGHTWGWALGASADGTVVVGESNGYGGYGSSEAFRWSADGEMVGLGFLDPDRAYSEARDVSADGNVIVGWSSVGSHGGREPFRWTADEGMISLGLLPGTVEGYATAVSGDGTVVIGRCFPGGFTVPRGFRWTAAEGMTHFDPGRPTDVSFDGRVIIGKTFRWTEETGAIALDDLPDGHGEPWFRAVSADARVIVGNTLATYGETAIIWDVRHGTRNLQRVLVNEYGLNLDGWRLGWATGVSADGTTIAGWGTHPDGMWGSWIARLPAPCFSDLDDDGTVGLSDLTQLLAHYRMSEGATYADGDLDADGDVDLSDLAALLPDYGTACP